MNLGRQSVPFRRSRPPHSGKDKLARILHKTLTGKMERDELTDKLRIMSNPVFALFSADSMQDPGMEWFANLVYGQIDTLMRLIQDPEYSDRFKKALERDLIIRKRNGTDIGFNYPVRVAMAAEVVTEHYGGKRYAVSRLRTEKGLIPQIHVGAPINGPESAMAQVAYMTPWVVDPEMAQYGPARLSPDLETTRITIQVLDPNGTSSDGLLDRMKTAYEKAQG